MNDELRKIAREVARELLAETRREDPPPTQADIPYSVEATTDVVRIESDADLDAFVRRLLTLLENPKVRRDVRLGKRRFRLRAAEAAAPGDTVIFSHGVVGERDLIRAAGRTSTIVLGKNARLTPLARDAAKSAGVSIVREPV